MSERILVVDDERVLANNIRRFLGHAGYAVRVAESGEQALELLAEAPAELLISDLRMPGMGGLALLERLRAEHPETLSLVITAHGTLDSAIQALRLGAQDYLLKPLSLEELERKVGRLLEHRALQQRVARLRQELHGRFDTEGLIAEAPCMQEVMRLVGKAAGSRSTALIEGESGTGKELIARALHEGSPWAERDFIAVNLAAQPAELVDATLFGHVRGAYTGATGTREGVFRAARGGTVFLDEVAELPMPVQVKLLRVLENREVMPLGSDRAEPVDFRLVAATNRPLGPLVAEGAFRQDLYFRLDVLRITLPPLREREEDIPALAARFLGAHAREMGRAAPRLSHEALRALKSWRWPGNVRELSNVMERAALLGEGEWVTLSDLPAELRGPPEVETQDLKEALARFERAHIARVLADCDGDKPLAAQRLGVHLATLYRRLERLEAEAAGVERKSEV
ncbi:MAG: sigma-54-dependent Fis family transcriptional regulator [Alphaproteobacteria bacterium]|nr:sigma-54-dependent Fis family transcriptional regulator [Alphaproteobacteria bacterium]